MSESLEVWLGYQFRNAALLQEALTHPSCNLEHPQADRPDYQRLEFLGDSILGAVVSHLLYRAYPKAAEGELAQRKSALVNGKAVAEISARFHLSDYLQLSKAEAQSGGRKRQSIIENVCEAIIGAIYLDGGYDAAFRFIETHWAEAIATMAIAPKDAKTRLQEWAQGRGLPLPDYREAAKSGPAHAPQFTVEVTVQGFPPMMAVASSKRAAEKLAAQGFLDTHEGQV